MNLKIYDPRDFPTYLPKLSELYDKLLSGGKGFRAHLVSQTCYALSAPDSLTHLLAQTVEFIHNASLLHDDLVDRSHFRRGKPAAWVEYGPEYAVLAGDYLLARVMVNLSAFGNIRLMHYTAEVISDLLEGEWLQDSLIHDFLVREEDLARVHQLKTASLFKWCFRAPFYAQNVEDKSLHDLLEEMGAILGSLFQRSDDLLDFDVRNHEGKAVLGDLKTGYLNSFGAFALRAFDESTKERAKRCQSLAEFQELVGGRAKFDQLVQSFDQDSEVLIQRYQAAVAALNQHYSSRFSSDWLGFLHKLPDYLYWRRA